MAFSASFGSAATSFFSGLVQPSSDYANIFKVHRGYDQASLKVSAMNGVGDVATWDGSTAISASTLDATAATINYSAYGCRVSLSYLQSEDSGGGLVEKCSKKIGISVANTYRNVCFNELIKAFAGGTTIADGKDLCANDHTVSGGATTRSNKITSALDSPGLWAAIAARRALVTYSGSDMSQSAESPMWLVVPPELEKTARQLLFSEQMASTADGTTNPLKTGFNIGLIVAPASTFDANDWLLCTDANAGFVDSSLQLWERSAPSLTVMTNPTSRSDEITCIFAIAAKLGPEPDSVIGSSVA